MYQRPEGLSHLIAPQMRPEECGHAARRAERRREERGSPRVCLYHFGAFLKGYKQGHVTFRGLNKKKKKLFYCNSAFLFILLVWAFKAVLVAMRLAQHIRVGQFLLISKCTFVACKQPMALVLLVGLLQPMPREGTGGPQKGSRCLKELSPTPSGKPHLLLLLFVSQNRGIVTGGLCFLPCAKEPQYAAFILFWFWGDKTCYEDRYCSFFFFF